MIALLIALVIFCAVIWAARSIMGAFGLGDPLATLIYVFIVLVGLVYLLNVAGIAPSLHVLR